MTGHVPNPPYRPPRSCGQNSRNRPEERLQTGGWRTVAARATPRLTLLLAFGMAACGDEAEPQSPLIVHRAWVPSDDAADPFFDVEQPTTSACDSFGNGLEDLDGEQTFFVQTQACPYLTVEQPAGRRVGVGQSLHVRMHHWALTSDRPARGHAAIATRDKVLWEYETDIPKAETDVTELVELAAPLEQGDPIYFHVHNHGDNEWALVDLSVED